MKNELFDLSLKMQLIDETVASNGYEEAIRLLKEMLEQYPNFSPQNSMYNIACMYSKLEQKELAFEWLQKSIEAGFYDISKIKSDEDFENIKYSDRFGEILRSLPEQTTGRKANSLISRLINKLLK